MGTYTVYMHTSPSNKKYVGITKNNPLYRWRNGNGYIGNIYFSRAINKYGWSNFKHEILFENLSKKEAEEKEIELISFYKSNNRMFGYNIENGGNCAGTHSEETKRKIGLKSQGNKHCLGRKITDKHIEAMRKGRISNGYKRSKHSEETKRKISESHKGVKFSEEHILHIKQNRPNTSGENNPMYGKHHSEDTKKKIAESKKGMKVSKETAERLKSIAKRVPVAQFDKNQNMIRVFNSVKEAADYVGANPQNISAVCRGKQKSCKGYFWRYLNDNS